MAEGRFVAYLRVSTEAQGRSGLGIEAQREAIMSYLNGGRWTLIAEFTEVETGKRKDRPELLKAIERCRLTGATLIIARLDRLSRNASFLLSLQDAGVDFLAVDMPYANRLTVGVMTLVAEEEARAISARTKAALAAAKARGVKLGNPRGFEGRVYRQGGPGARRKATAFAETLAPTLKALRAEGLSANAMAKHLADAGIKTARGGTWSAQSVLNVMRRLGIDHEASARR